MYKITTNSKMLLTTHPWSYDLIAFWVFGNQLTFTTGCSTPQLHDGGSLKCPGSRPTSCQVSLHFKIPSLCCTFDVCIKWASISLCIAGTGFPIKNKYPVSLRVRQQQGAVTKLEKPSLRRLSHSRLTAKNMSGYFALKLTYLVPSIENNFECQISQLRRA